MSVTPARHFALVVPSARKAKTSAGDRAILTVLLASGIDTAPGKERLELVKPTLPTHVVRRRPMAGGELGVGEHQFGLLATVHEIDAHQRLGSVSRRTGLPAPRVEQPGGRMYLTEGAANDERVPFRRLHRQPVAATGSEVDLGLWAGELARPPPVADLLWLGPSAEHLLAWRVDDPGDPNRAGRLLGGHVPSFADLKWSASESRRRSQK